MGHVPYWVPEIELMLADAWQILPLFYYILSGPKKSNVLLILKELEERAN